MGLNGLRIIKACWPQWWSARSSLKLN
jgi:hypothetical protein